MPQVFNRHSNTIARLSILGGVASLFLVAILAYGMVRSPYSTGQGIPYQQPVPFSHAHHVGGDGIDCRYCHTSVTTSATAGMPPTQTCMNCHREIWTNSPLLEPVRASWQTDQPIEWNRVDDLPGFVYFNHSIHIHKGIGCSTCHGRVDRMQITYQAYSFTMQWCLNCHNHPERYVRPRSQVFNMDYKAPDNQIELGHKLVRLYHIERKVSCSVCHR